MAGEAEWLEEKNEFLFPGQAENKKADAGNALVFAQKYLVFSGPNADPRARDIFEHFSRVTLRRKIPVTAPIAEYAAHQALVELIEGIRAQIELANNGLNQPTPRT